MDWSRRGSLERAFGTQGSDIVGIHEVFAGWRAVDRVGNSYGLAWYLAYEFCKRYYSSHGIVPYVIHHESLGYYGIRFDEVKCRLRDTASDGLGRITMCGDVENWRTGEPGDHGLEAIKMHVEGRSTSEIVLAAVRHMALPAMPDQSHIACRHKRWGDSYSLCFEVVAIMAIQSSPEELYVWNHPDHVQQALRERDSEWQMKEHPGAFALVAHDQRLLMAGDGRLLDGSGVSLWHEYMAGSTAAALAKTVWTHLDQGEDLP